MSICAGNAQATRGSRVWLCTCNTTPTGGRRCAADGNCYSLQTQRWVSRVQGWDGGRHSNGTCDATTQKRENACADDAEVGWRRTVSDDGNADDANDDEAEEEGDGDDGNDAGCKGA